MRPLRLEAVAVAVRRRQWVHLDEEQSVDDGHSMESTYAGL